VTQLVLPLHECATEPLQDATEAVATPATADHEAAEFATEPLHVVADHAAALTEISCLCVRV
jgi:hypothetical protein